MPGLPGVLADTDAIWPYLRAIVQPVTRLLTRAYGYGVDRVPVTGGAVLAINHFAAIDPPLVGCFTRRPIYYMAKQELIDVPVAGPILRHVGTFAVRRGESDREAVRRARELVANGKLLGLFVEGTRQPYGHPGRARPGAAMIAIQEGAPILPCGLDSFGWSLGNRRPCAVVFGDPIPTDDLPRGGRGYRQASGLVEEELVRLWRLAAGAVAAGFPETLPDGTRRSGMLPFRIDAHPELVER